VPGVAREEQRVAPAAQSVRRDAREKKLIVARPNCQTPEHMSRMSRTISATRIAMWRGDRRITPSRRRKCQTARGKMARGAEKVRRREGKVRAGEDMVVNGSGQFSGAVRDVARRS
jgi:hypothetical protein